MSLKTQIEENLNQALKDKDKNTYPTLRLVVSAIKDAEISNRTKENKSVSDQDIMSILKKEIEIISVYLPKQLSDEETKRICVEVIKLAGANSRKDMGKVMGLLKSKYADTLDFAKVNSVIKELLN